MPSWIEREFREAWEALAPDILLEEEYSAIPVWEEHYLERKSLNPHSKRWRADFAIPPAQILIECQGAIWKSNGAHSRGAGLEHDFRKQYYATLSGWQVVLVSGNMVNRHEEWMPGLVEYVRKKLAQGSQADDRAGIVWCVEPHPNPALRPQQAASCLRATAVVESTSPHYQSRESA